MSEEVVEFQDYRAIEQLLYTEASLLDDPDLDGWMELYTEDGTYWMPASHGQEDPEMELSHIYDDRVMMEIRRRNFRHPRSASKEYEIRSSHIISNIRVTAADGETGDVTVSSNFHVLVYYMSEQTTYGGTYTHVLANTEAGYRIRSKRVNLINCEATHRSITIYL
jgi:benzoate/toluate 1,2-dioxygenase beta subunit